MGNSARVDTRVREWIMVDEPCPGSGRQIAEAFLRNFINRFAMDSLVMLGYDE
jgi:hypothetical protein